MVLLVLHARDRRFIGLGNRQFQVLQLLGGIVGVGAQRIVANDLGVGLAFLLAEAVAELSVSFAHVPQCEIGLAIQRILIYDMAIAVGGGGIITVLEIETAHQVLTFGKGFLNIAQKLFGLVDVLAVGELRDERATFVFGAESLRWVAIRLVHLLVMDLADLFLGFGRLFHGGIEQDE